MRRLCDVPECKRDGRHVVASGWMCLKHALRWDKANAQGDVYRTDDFIAAGPDAPDDLVADDCHAKWLGRTMP